MVAARRRGGTRGRLRGPAGIALLACGLRAGAVSSPLSHRLGTHLVMEVWGVRAHTLDDESYLARVLADASEAAGLTVLQSAFHRFSPQGVTGVVLLSESHTSVHTWPEYGYAAIDLFSCGARLEMPCGETVTRSGGGGEVVMNLNASAATSSGLPHDHHAGWTCADGSAPRRALPTRAYVRSASAPHAALAEAEHHAELKDLWAGVVRVVEMLRPQYARLRRFERGIPGAPLMAAPPAAESDSDSDSDSASDVEPAAAPSSTEQQQPGIRLT